MGTPPEPPTLAMRLRDLETGLRGHVALAHREAGDAWARKGTGRCLSIRDVLSDFLRRVEAHAMELGELTESIEGSSHGVILERNNGKH